MRPKRRRSPDLFFDTFPSPLGKLYLRFSGETLTGIDFEKPLNTFRPRTSNESLLFKKQLSAYFRGDLKAFDQRIMFLEGTDFEKGLWLSLKEIPFGEKRTYRWLAERMNIPKGARAVGQALGKNPLPLVLPCHRIVRSDGSLGGYSPGVWMKEWLLKHEQRYRDDHLALKEAGER